ncbi:uncharacterized protein EAF02_004536 [Botrytis sinoallii]|uniref:uncharacterized protein n=1 Tax=Botrytis sinoallii TaxID=1463999 RepID=UPI0018FFF8A5|nr:uncharacterized protein EAF02_004536 [Botrytis sinoallii]KAF7884200.1 hypothetical protein EAF02_004536 [Botrytis sinoallii]
MYYIYIPEYSQVARSIDPDNIFLPILNDRVLAPRKLVLNLGVNYEPTRNSNSTSSNVSWYAMGLFTRSNFSPNEIEFGARLFELRSWPHHPQLPRSSSGKFPFLLSLLIYLGLLSESTQLGLLELSAIASATQPQETSLSGTKKRNAIKHKETMSGSIGTSSENFFKDLKSKRSC